MDAYMKSQEAFSSIFQDKEKYDAIMRAIGEMLIRQARRGWDEDSSSDTTGE